MINYYLFAGGINPPLEEPVGDGSTTGSASPASGTARQPRSARRGSGA